MDNNILTSTNNAQPKNIKKRKHKLEIQIYDLDWTNVDDNAGGKPIMRPVARGGALDDGRPIIIEVADEKELNDIRQQYKLCGQVIKVIREIDPFVDDSTPKKQKPNIPQDNQAIPMQISSNSVDDTSSKHEVELPVQVVQQSLSNGKQKSKPKIVTIGDIEVKYDCDKIYQKQWMKLTPAESANFRIVNDSNNKIFNMNGKHIEDKRWILVEDHIEEATEDAIESILNN